LGITLLTVTHRRSLQQLHQHVMKFDGNGSYKMGRVRDPAFAVGTPVTPKAQLSSAVGAAAAEPRVDGGH
jgi:ABC-type uncharacterized transport system fused permease/ATPase subunit